MKFAILLFASLNTQLSAQVAHAETTADSKEVKFAGEISSKSPYTLKFHAPAKHHFNQGGPTKVELVNGADVKVAKLDKSLQLVTASFEKDAKPAADCIVKAQLFVCDDANTYCLPVKQNYDCQKLQVKN